MEQTDYSERRDSSLPPPLDSSILVKENNKKITQIVKVCSKLLRVAYDSLDHDSGRHVLQNLDNYFESIIKYSEKDYAQIIPISAIKTKFKQIIKELDKIEYSTETALVSDFKECLKLSLNLRLIPLFYAFEKIDSNLLTETSIDIDRERQKSNPSNDNLGNKEKDLKSYQVNQKQEPNSSSMKSWVKLLFGNCFLSNKKGNIYEQSNFRGSCTSRNSSGNFM